MKIRVNSDGVTSDIIDDSKRNSSCVYATIHRTFRRRKNRRETFVLKFNDSAKGIDRVAKEVLSFSRSYAKSKGAFIRIDGDQYIDILFDKKNILNPFMLKITNIYIEYDNGLYINTITDSDIEKIIDSDIEIIYAPMNSSLFKRNYAVYRILDNGPSLIRLGCNRKREIALPWIIVDDASHDISSLNILPPVGKKINGLAVHALGMNTDPITLPMIDPDFISDEDFNIEVNGKTIALLEMNFNELSEYIGHKINLTGIGDILDIKIDVDILNKLKDSEESIFLKKKYALLVKEIIENSDNTSVFPLWRKIYEWAEQEIPCVFRIKFSRIGNMSYSTIALNALVKEYAY